MGKKILDEDRLTVSIEKLKLEDEGKAHALAMRTFWEVIPLASAVIMCHPVKMAIICFVMYSTTSRVTMNSITIYYNTGFEFVLLCCVAEYICSILPYGDSNVSAMIGILSGLAMLISLILDAIMFPGYHSVITVVVYQISLHITITHILHFCLVQYINYTCWVNQADYRHLCSYWMPGKHVMFVAKSAGTRGSADTCATIGIVHQTDSLAILKRVAVEPAMRGRGIATDIVNHAIRHCKDIGYKYIALNVSHLQLDAKKLYLKLGFKYFYTEIWYKFMRMDWYVLKLDGTTIDDCDERFLKLFI